MATLRALECLVAVVDSGSITQAALLLHSSQPAVSHQLASLERETRTVLLRREPRGVKLTSAGRAAVADARRAIEAAASAMRSARAAGQAAGGVLRLVCAQSLTASVTATAPQLAAAGLGIAVCPVSAVSHGFPGVVRSFSPRWVRQLVAVTSTEPDPLVARFVGDLRGHGMSVPRDVRDQLAQRGLPDEAPPTTAGAAHPGAGQEPT